MTLKELKSILSKYELLVITGAFVILLILFEQAVETEFLKCPCDKTENLEYNELLNLLIATSCLVLSVIGLAINPNFWRLIVGFCSVNRCCTGPCCCKPSCKKVFFPTWFPCKLSIDCCGMECCYYPGMRCVRIFLFAILFPFFWTILITVDGDYWACINTNNPYEIPKNQSCQVSLLSLLPKKYNGYLTY